MRLGRRKVDWRCAGKPLVRELHDLDKCQPSDGVPVDAKRATVCASGVRKAIPDRPATPVLLNGAWAAPAQEKFSGDPPQ